MNRDARSGCPINAALETFGDTWTLLVLRDMTFGNRRYFSELMAKSDEGIASNILADRLRRLVDAGLLTREDVGRGRKAKYSLTEDAIELVPVFAALGSWGLRQPQTTKPLRARARMLAKGGQPMWDDLMDELRIMHLGAPARTWAGQSPLTRLGRAFTRAS